MLIVEAADLLADPRRQLIHLLHAVSIGFDQLTDSEGDRNGVEFHRVHGQQLIGADQRHWDDRQSGPDSHEGRTVHEALGVARSRPAPFRKDKERHSGAEGLYRSAEARDRCARIGNVDGDLPGTLQVPADKRKLEEVMTGNNPELKRKAGKNNGRVRIGKMVRGIDGDAPVQLLFTQDCDPGAADEDDRVPPEAGDGVLDFAALVPEGGQQREAAKEASAEEKERCAEAKAGEPLRPGQRMRPWPKSGVTHPFSPVRYGRAAPTRYTDPVTTTSPSAGVNVEACRRASSMLLSCCKGARVDSAAAV